MNFEKGNLNSSEGENDPEVVKEVESLNATAEELGEQLESADPQELETGDINKIRQSIDMVFGALGAVVGSASFAIIWREAVDFEHPMGGVEGVFATVTAAAGIAAAVVGFEKIIIGARAFLGKLTPEQKAEFGVYTN